MVDDTDNREIRDGANISPNDRCAFWVQRKYDSKYVFKITIFLHKYSLIVTFEINLFNYINCRYCAVSMDVIFGARCYEGHTIMGLRATTSVCNQRPVD